MISQDFLYFVFMLVFDAHGCPMRDAPTWIHFISMVRLQQTYMEDWVILDLWRQLHLVSLCSHLFEDRKGTLISPKEAPMSSF